VTATAGNFNGWAPEGIGAQLPPDTCAPQQASLTIGRGQYVTYNASGHAALNDGTVPGLVCAGVGYPAPISGSSTIAGQAFAQLWQGFGQGNPSSTIANDAFTAADTCTPAYIKDENTLGKLSNYSGSNRSLAGLVFGVSPDARVLPRAWVGVVAQTVARGVLIADSFMLASTEIADAAASTAISEKAISRPKVKGTITSIEFTGAAIAADNTDYITVTVSKRTAADPGTAVSLGTYDSRAANNGAITAFVPAAFTLSVVANALFLLPTDVVTITTVKGASGKVITGAVLVNGKAI
jgi:hypothetical protein